MNYEEVIGTEKTNVPVRSLQYMLNQLAIHDPKLIRLTVDGIFGERTLEAVMVFQREYHPPVTGVVDMGVGNQDVVDGIGGEGQLMVVDFVPPLLQAAIDQDSLPVDLEAVTAASNALVRTIKVQFHEIALLVFCVT